MVPCVLNISSSEAKVNVEKIIMKKQTQSILFTFYLLSKNDSPVFLFTRFSCYGRVRHPPPDSDIGHGLIAHKGDHYPGRYPRPDNLTPIRFGDDGPAYIVRQVEIKNGIPGVILKYIDSCRPFSNIAGVTTRTFGGWSKSCKKEL